MTSARVMMWGKTIGASVFVIGHAIGPLFGGIVITNSGFTELGQLVVGGTVIGFVLYAISLRRQFGSKW